MKTQTLQMNHLNNTNKVQTIILLTSILCIIISSIALVSTLNTLKKNSIQLISVNEKLCQTNADYDKNSEIDLQDFSLFKKYYISCSRDSASANCKDGDLTCDLNTSLEDFQEFKDQFSEFNLTNKLRYLVPKSTNIQVPAPEVFYDDFSNLNNDWYTGDVKRMNFWDEGNFRGIEDIVANINFVNNQYQIYIPRHRYSNPPGDVDTFWVWPALKAPIPENLKPLPDTYCIEAKAHFDKPTWIARWGIVFGGNDAFDDLYVFNITDNKNRAVINYQNYIFPGNLSHRHCVYQNDCNINHKHFLIDWYSDGGQNQNIHEAPTSNTLKVVVKTNSVDFYINDQLIDTWQSSNFPKENIGIMGGSWEVTPVDLRFDYFKYEPNCAESLE